MSTIKLPRAAAPAFTLITESGESSFARASYAVSRALLERNLHGRTADVCGPAGWLFVDGRLLGDGEARTAAPSCRRSATGSSMPASPTSARSSACSSLASMWPNPLTHHPQPSQARKEPTMLPDFTWLPSTAEEFNARLNVLPPLEWVRRSWGEVFLLGEPYDHDDEGAARYLIHRRVGIEYTRGSRPVTIAESRRLQAAGCV